MKNLIIYSLGFGIPFFQTMKQFSIWIPGKFINKNKSSKNPFNDRYSWINMLYKFICRDHVSMFEYYISSWKISNTRHMKSLYRTVINCYMGFEDFFNILQCNIFIVFIWWFESIIMNLNNYPIFKTLKIILIKINNYFCSSIYCAWKFHNWKYYKYISSSL